MVCAEASTGSSYYLGTQGAGRRAGLAPIPRMLYTMYDGRLSVVAVGGDGGLGVNGAFEKAAGGGAG